MDALRAGRGDPPGILTLLELVDQHRGAFEYDWRTRFGVALSDVPARMGWGEAWRLTQQLLTDTSSHVAAAVMSWPHAWPREAFVLADLYDLTAAGIPFKRKPKAYPRPSDPRPARYGDASKHSQQAIREALAARGHGRLTYKRDARGRLHDHRGRFVAG